MKDCPDSGWVVPLDVFKPCMTPEDLTRLDDVAKCDTESYEEFLKPMLEKLHLSDFFVVVLDDDDQSDDIERHTPYVVFPFTSLYQLSPKPGMVNLQNLQITPVHSHWTIFG